MIQVGVFGAGGRMGATVCEAVASDPDMNLVAAVDPYGVGASAGGVVAVADRQAVVDAGADVVVDFTIAEAARDNLVWLAEQRVHAVVGTTGFKDGDLERFQAAFEAAERACIIAPNFAISAVLMMRFAELAAPYFETAEVIELHHDAKIDAPSGTARLTVEKMAAASDAWAPDPTEHEMLSGIRGAEGPAGIRVHAVRMRGMVAHHEVILGAEGQTLTIRQDSTDRSSFMPGVLAAVKAAPDHTGLIVGLDALLDI
ncbi:MAG: 4-hydroxy-tetrahydrodipicolinate reductase [Acidimicrobiia bacterium]|nr:4-hydroxy-tetrahydrodipicolinate reductase [Acidimicrobiia bacterium]MYG59121.1 4-hydroxy-tetrahydrodipicolinate reductase [Acidimicrobiia bacterium]MYJ33255.1 4-hydroxy-tetrahydrodipicolinate reductase [Acidimicrobiia bacterium]